MLKKMYSVSLITICIMLSITIVANAFGINVVELAIQRMGLITSHESSNATTELEKQKVAQINDLTIYIEKYKDDIEKALAKYSKDETKKAKDQLKQEYDAIIDSLEKEKKNIIKQGENNIKTEIDSKKDDIRTEIDNHIENEFNK